MAQQYCEQYRGWHMWFDTEGGYTVAPHCVGPAKRPPHDANGYYETREQARQEIDWLIEHPDRTEEREVPPDTPSLDPPWWEYR